MISQTKPKRIVIIGAVAAGTKTAARARRLDATAEITLLTEEAFVSYAGCGQPYYIGDEIKTQDQLLARPPEYFRDVMEIDLHTRHCVTAIDSSAKTLQVTNLETSDESCVSYDSLVIATGAKPFVPPIEGTTLPGVFAVRTIPDIEAMRQKVDSGDVKRAVVIGGGYIGLEMAENLRNRNIDVTVIEREPQVAPLFDADVAAHIQNTLEAHGIKVMLQSPVQRIVGSLEGGVTAVVVNNEELPTDLVVLSVGVKPNVALAKNAGIRLGETGAIQVDDHMRTNISEIYAAGDCAESLDIVTGKPAWVALGSTANRQGRVLGTNITGGDASFDGITATSIFRVFELSVAKAGLSEAEAKQHGYDYEAAIVPAPDKPHYMPGINKVIIKLIADRKTERVLGAEIWGAGSVDKCIDTMAAMLKFKATVDDLTQLDLAYAPPFSPALGCLITAANVLQNKLNGEREGILPLEVLDKIERGENLFFLDVRDPQDCLMICVEECVNIPLSQLKNRLSELPRDQEIIISCAIGARASMAYLILKQNGFIQVKYMDGGITAWPKPIPVS